MPRTSAAARAAVESILSEPRLPPPEHLDAEAKADWIAIVEKFPASHFGSDNAPLLEQLVEHLGLARHLDEQLAETRGWRLTATTAAGARRRETFIALLAARRGETATISSLCTKLRLSNSSHRNDRMDERRLSTLPNAHKPWERQ
jgi:hypothetical protein